MTLFWHGHFTTAAIQKGVTPAEVVAQNELFRSYALGNVRELTGKVALDPAMLRYLDNIHNEAAHPNENFARELMELYTLGIGNYSEADVREAARAWTGLRVRRATGEVFLNPRLHDAGSKTFLGRTGNFAGAGYHHGDLCPAGCGALLCDEAFDVLRVRRSRAGAGRRGRP